MKNSSFLANCRPTLIVLDGFSGAGKSSLHLHYQQDASSVFPFNKEIAGLHVDRNSAGRLAEQRVVSIPSFQRRMQDPSFMWYEFSGNLYGFSSRRLLKRIYTRNLVMVIVRDINVLSRLKDLAKRNGFGFVSVFLDCPVERRIEYLRRSASEMEIDSETQDIGGVPVSRDVEVNIGARLNRDGLPYPVWRQRNPIYDCVIQNNGSFGELVRIFEVEVATLIGK